MDIPCEVLSHMFPLRSSLMHRVLLLGSPVETEKGIKDFPLLQSAPFPYVPSHILCCMSSKMVTQLLAI